MCKHRYPAKSDGRYGFICLWLIPCHLRKQLHESALFVQSVISFWLKWLNVVLDTRFLRPTYPVLRESCCLPEHRHVLLGISLRFGAHERRILSHELLAMLLGYSVFDIREPLPRCLHAVSLVHCQMYKQEQRTKRQWTNRHNRRAHLLNLELKNEKYLTAD